MSVQTLDFDRSNKAGSPVQLRTSQALTRLKKKLCILSGANKRAIVYLNNGLYSLGGNENCDLIISDPEVSDRHLFLEISHNEMIIVPIETLVYINGKPCTERQSINFFDVVMMGQTSFCIGPRKKAWPKIKPVKPVKPDESGSLIKEQVEIDPSVERKQVEIKRRLQQNIKITQFVSPVLLLFGLVLLILSFGMFMPAQAITKTTTPKDAINRLIKQEQLQQSIFLRNASNGELELSGYVTDLHAFNKLKSAILNKHPAVNIRVWSIADLQLRTEEILRSLGVTHVKVDVVNAGNLAVSGYVPDKTDWSRIQQTLIKDVPDVVNINDDQIYSLKEVADFITSHIEKAHLDQWLTVNMQSGTLLIAGVLPEDQYPVWKQTLKKYIKHMKFDIDVDDNQVINAKKQKINLPVKSISIGDVSYLTLKDNSKYIVGSLIADGFVLKSIHLNHVVISKNNIDYNYLIGAKHD